MAERFFQNLEVAKGSIQSAIATLKHWEETITEENYSQFGLTINEHRDLDTVYSDYKAVDFRQMSPITLTITMEDTRLLGKELGANKAGPWQCPTVKEVTAVDEKLKELLKKKVSKRKILTKSKK
jgi:hypothetical protein